MRRGMAVVIGIGEMKKIKTFHFPAGSCLDRDNPCLAGRYKQVTLAGGL